MKKNLKDTMALVIRLDAQSQTFITKMQNHGKGRVNSAIKRCYRALQLNFGTVIAFAISIALLIILRL